MSKTSIAKNTSYFTLALIFQKVISFSYFAILASRLDPKYLGAYYTAISLATMFSILVDLGLTNMLTREVAKNKEQAEKLLASVISIKIPLAIISAFLFVITVNLLGYSQLIKNLSYILLITMTFDPFVSSFFAVTRGFQNLKFESISVVVYQLIVLVIGITALNMGASLEVLAIGLAIATIFNFIFSLLVLKLKWKMSLKPVWNKSLIKGTILLSVPFALFAILQRVYMYLDTVLLSVLAGEEYVGLYQIAFKIVFALQFLPMAFIASLYPAFALYFKENKEQLLVSFTRAMNYLIIISVPISAGIISLSDIILKIFKPEYIDSISSLRLIMLSLPFIFINFPIGSLLNACNKQKQNTRNMAIVLIASIVLNLVLIPHFKTLGATITVLATNILMFVLGIIMVYQIINYKISKNIITFIKAMFAATVMVVFLLYFKQVINIFVIIPIAALIYFFVIFFTGGVKIEDVKSFGKSFK